MLTLLVVGIGHHFGHTLDVFAIGLHQAVQIELRLGQHRLGLQAKAIGEVFDGRAQPLGQLDKGSSLLARRLGGFCPWCAARFTATSLWRLLTKNSIK